MQRCPPYLHSQATATQEGIALQALALQHTAALLQ
jgi:hypothetical protein